MQRLSLFTAVLVSVLGACGLSSCCCEDTSDLPVGGFVLTVTPGTAITGPGEHFVMLASITNEGNGSGPVALTATCPGAQVSMDPASISVGEVAEITVIPDATAPTQASTVGHTGSQIGQEPDWTLTLAVAGARDGQTHQAGASIGIIQQWDTGLLPEAISERDRIIPWLAANHPELGITSTTVWTPAMPNPVLVVSHYLFYSEEWELHVAWHVMIPPYDWTKYELRRRRSETVYSTGFIIESRSAEPPLDPVAMTPENTLWR
jgi:hypothetical protein